MINREIFLNTVTVASLLLSILLLLASLGMDTSVSGANYSGRVVNLSLMRQQEQMFILGVVFSCVTGWWCTKRFESFLTFAKYGVRLLLGALFTVLATMTFPWELVVIYFLLVFLVIRRRSHTQKPVVLDEL
jgi:hypothetical protein